MLRVILGCLVLAGVTPLHAQNTAMPVIPGYLSMRGCPSTALTPCFIATGGGTPVNITTSTSTLVKTGAGVFLGLSVNTGQAGDTVTVYDGLTAGGTKIGTYSSAAVGGPTLPSGGIAFSTGLFVVTTGGTPADITVSYR
jgi:hypothetical protein